MKRWIILFISLFIFRPVAAEQACAITLNQNIASYINVHSYCTVYTLSAGTYHQNVVLDRSVTLQGAGQNQTIIDGGGNGSVVAVTSYKFVTLTDLTLQNGSSVNGGGVRMDNGWLTLERVTIQDNVATGRGGGVFMGRYAFTLRESLIQRNSAAQGGGLYATYNGSTYETDFIDNSAASEGGGLYLAGGDRTSLTNIDLRGNSATLGGGIYHTSDDSDDFLTVQFSTMEQNSAHIGGSLYFTNLFDFTGQGITFHNNHATNGDGGAIYANGSSGKIKLDNILMPDNSASAEGGAIFLENAVSMVISNATFEDNSASERGGTIAAIGETVTSDLYNIIIRNGVGNAGGGIFVFGGSLLLDNALFDSNQASANGGAIVSTGELTVRNGSRFIYNSAETGGAIQGSGRIDVADATFEHNDALSGGGIYAAPNTVFILQDVAMTNNSATVGGGAIESFSTAQISRALIADNRAGSTGGGISGPVRMFESAVVRNQATRRGGGIIGSDVVLHNVTVSENFAGTDGSGIFASTLLLDRVTIADNYGTNALFQRITSASTINNTLFSNPGVANCAGELSSTDFSTTFSEDTSCTGTANDPLLAPLADNGGNTLTHALLPNSPAIGAGTACGGIDQRGFGRPANGCDAGAYEDAALSPTSIALQSLRLETRSSLFVILGTAFLFLFTAIALNPNKPRITSQITR